VTDLLVGVPSYGRPDNVRRLFDDWVGVRRADLIVGLDRDDPTLTAYPEAEYPARCIKTGEPAQFVEWVNRLSVPYVQQYRFLGSMTDHHVPRTPGWDIAITNALAEMGTGIVYPNDGWFGEAIPTACFMTSDIVQALGFMALPTLQHFACDNVWRDWGLGIDRIRYMPEVVIELMHSGAGKAPMDATQIRSELHHAHDGEVYKRYLTDGIDADIAKLRSLVR